MTCKFLLHQKDRQYFVCNFDRFRKLLIIFDTNCPDNLSDLKIVKCPNVQSFLNLTKLRPKWHI